MKSTRIVRPRRVIAFDVRSRKFGYAVFEGPKRLLDFGLVGFTTPRTAKQRLQSLLRHFQPHTIALCRTQNFRRNRARTRPLVSAVHRAARSAGIPVASISDISLRKVFATWEVRNKDQRASLLAGFYPHLRPKLPPRRRTWQHEHWSMPVFDAVAVGIAYLEASGAHIDTLVKCARPRSDST